MKWWAISVHQHKTCSTPSAQTQRAILAQNQVLPSAFRCHHSRAEARYPVPGYSPKCSVWITNWAIAAHPWKHRHCDAVGQGLNSVQGLSLDEIVKKIGTVFLALALKKSCLVEGMPECTDSSGQMCQGGCRATRIWDRTASSPSQKQ